MTNFDPNKIRALILDMDGVIWRGEECIGDLASIFAEIDRRGWGLIMATNNSTRTPSQYIQRLRSFDVELEDWQIVNSSEATAYHLSQQYPDGGPVYIIGENGLFESLQAKGFYPNETNPLAVVVGMDRHLTYDKIKQANHLIRAGAKFIGTNPDKTFPTPEGLTPGSGTMLAAVEAASSVSPTIIGKPQPAMYSVAMNRLGTRPDETLVVGDRLETDIAGAQNSGCLAALVLSGVTTRKMADEWMPAIDIIAADLTNLLNML